MNASDSETVRLTFEVYRNDAEGNPTDNLVKWLQVRCRKASCWTFGDGLTGEAREAWELLTDKIDKQLKMGPPA